MEKSKDKDKEKSKKEKDDDLSSKKLDKITYESLWKSIIRPPRDTYSIDELGPTLFRFNNIVYTRNDYDVLDFQGNILKLSFIEPIPENRPSDKMPVVIYLHENCASRIQALGNKILKICLLKHNINLCCFDFAGSGLSEGQYISLGYHEKNQVKNVVDFIERLSGVGNIGLWGRSMGAATTLLYAPNDKRIKCIVVDSPFSDFRKLAKEICKNNVNFSIPSFLIEGAISIIGSTVKSKNGMDINDIKPINSVKKCSVPALFLHAVDDTFVNYEHSEALFKNYSGEIKKLKGIKGGHNGIRPREIMEEIGEFFAEYLIPDYLDEKLLKNFENENKKNNKTNINDNINIESNKKNMENNN